MGGPREAIRFHDVFHAREETTRTGWLYLALVIITFVVIVVAARRGENRGANVTQARGPTPERAAAVLLTHALADAQPLHELRPSAEDGLLALLLLLLRRGVLGLPVCLRKNATTT